MNCAPGCAVLNTCSGSGWPSTPFQRSFLSSSWVPARKTWHRGSSIPCDRSWPPFCLPLFTSDGLNLYFYALTAHFGQWLEVGLRGRQWQVAAELIYGQVKKSYRRRKLVRVTHVMRLGTCAALEDARPRIGPVWTTEHRFHRAGSTDGASWRGGSGTPHLGEGSAYPTTAGSLGMVAGFLSFRAPPRITTDSARAAARARRQVGSATLPAAHSSHGSREKHPTVVNAGSPVLSFATTAMLHNVSGYKARRRPVK